MGRVGVRGVMQMFSWVGLTPATTPKLIRDLASQLCVTSHSDSHNNASVDGLGIIITHSTKQVVDNYQMLINRFVSSSKLNKKRKQTWTWQRQNVGTWIRLPGWHNKQADNWRQLDCLLKTAGEHRCEQSGQDWQSDTGETNQATKGGKTERRSSWK